MNLQDCPKLSRCNAPICPLDHEWRKRRMLNHEPVCFYLLEYAKAGAEARFEWRGLDELYAVIGRELPGLQSRWGRIRRFYERAAQSNSRLDRLQPSPQLNLKT